MPKEVMDALGAAVDPVNNTQIPAVDSTLSTQADGSVQDSFAASPLEKFEEAPQQEQTQDNTEQVAEKVAESAGLNMESLSSAWYEKGELPEDAYSKFQEMGLPREAIDQICSNVATAEEQRVASFKSDVASSVGGEDNLKTLVEFVKSPTFDNRKRDELMAMVTLENPTQSKLALQEVQKMYEAEHGSSGNLVTGQKSGGGSDIFTSRKEQSEAIITADRSRDPSLIKAAAEKAARTSQYNRKNGISF